MIITSVVRRYIPVITGVVGVHVITVPLVKSNLMMEAVQTVVSFVSVIQLPLQIVEMSKT